MVKRIEGQFHVAEGGQFHVDIYIYILSSYITPNKKLHEYVVQAVDKVLSKKGVQTI